MASVPLYGSNKQSSSHSMHCSSVGGTLWPVFLFMVVTSSPVPIPCTVVVLVAHCGQCSSLWL